MSSNYMEGGKEVDPSKQARNERGIAVEEYYGQTVWDGTKLVSPQEWKEQQK